jgi:membrane-anchored mycosin MYCP
MTRHRMAVACGLALLTLTCPVPSAGAAPDRCDTPVAGDRLPLDVALPHDLSTGRGVPVRIVDTGAAAPGVTGDRDSCALHGTAVAGVVRSVAPDADISSARQDPDRGTVADLVRQLGDAAEAGRRHELRVVNLSLVACEDTAELRQVVTEVAAAGVLLVASAGNTGQCGDGQLPFPASLPEVLTVGAVDPRVDGASTVADLGPGRQVADYSVAGPWVDIHAPGGPVSAVLEGDGGSSVIVGTPAPFTGTSFAAPVVSATAALVWQVRPDLGLQEVRDLLTATAQPGPAPVVDPAAAVTAALDGSPLSRERGAPWPEAVPVVRTTDEPRQLGPLVLLVMVVLAAMLVAGVLRRPR